MQNFIYNIINHKLRIKATKKPNKPTISSKCQVLSKHKIKTYLKLLKCFKKLILTILFY